MYLYFGAVAMLAPAIAGLALLYTWPLPARGFLLLLAAVIGKKLSLPVAGEMAWMFFWRPWQDARKRNPAMEWAMVAVAAIILYTAWRWGMFLPLVELVVLVSIFALMQALRRTAHV